MPNERRSSSHRCYRPSPYARYNKNNNDNNSSATKSPSLPIGNKDDWDETRCPICMEHPHNAVLLLCSSREKGCLPYICDTSARHSNCLDQFKKTFINEDGEQMKLACPLCRGQISKWIVVNPAREFMNKKSRSCSMSTCDYSGNYLEIRQHARRDHPCGRPTDVDPKRELEWTKLEQDLEQQDMLSMQFEFDEDDDVDVDDVNDDDNEDDDDINTMDGYELVSPIWDPDMNILNFFSAFEAEFGTFFQELDAVAETSDLLADWDEGLDLLPSPASPLLRATEIEESGQSRELTSINNIQVPVENARTTRTRANTRGGINSMRLPVENSRAARTRANTRGRPRSNAPPSSHNREEQVTTLVDFHELRSNMP